MTTFVSCGVQFEQLRPGSFELATAACAPGELQSGLAGEPFVLVRMQFHQFAHAQLRQIADIRLLRLAVGDFVDAARRAVHAGALVAFAGVAPVEDEDAAVGAVAEVDAAEPRVAEEERVRPCLPT